jgi:tRNA modification GTPase
VDGETIFAVASPAGRGSLALIRLSGRQAIPAVAAISVEGGSALSALPGFRGAPVILGLDGARHAAWATVFRSPRSYTREDMVELLLPGSMPVLGAASRALAAGGRARWARPGEFTLRGFLNGRLDLLEAEAVGRLIGAAGEAEARAARRGLRGEPGAGLEALRREVIDLAALIEAAIDFPDEDLPDLAPALVDARIAGVERRLEGLSRSAAVRAPSDGLVRAVLAGFPNAGKSTLLNAILGRPAAITHAMPGTTRDPVRGVAEARGRRIEWIDVAGAFDAGAFSPGAAGEERQDAPTFGGSAGEEEIWRIARRLTRIEIENADCVVWVADPSERLGDSIREFHRLVAGRKVLVVGKADLLDPACREELARLPEAPVIASGRRRTGLEDLAGRVLEAGKGAPAAARGEPRFLVSAFQEASLEAAREALARARSALGAGLGLECVASDLRDARRAIEDVIGVAPREAILETIFSRFCIGK